VRPEDSRAEPAAGALEQPAGHLDTTSQSYIRQTLSYVPTIARRYQGRGLAFDELIAAGNLGLVEAALRFDPARKVRFTTYAVWWIRKAMLEALGRQSGAMRLPRYQYDRLKTLRVARANWVARRGSAPTPEELALAAGLSLDEVTALDALSTATVSLEQPLNPDDSRPVKELLEDRLAENPDRALLRRDLSQRLRLQLSELTQRERQVLTLRYGLADGAPRTLRDTARKLGVSRERVRQVELRALRKLRHLLP
jgi:RNA polymerase primary sigma factor